MKNIILKIYLRNTLVLSKFNLISNIGLPQTATLIQIRNYQYMPDYIDSLYIHGNMLYRHRFIETYGTYSIGAIYL